MPVIRARKKRLTLSPAGRQLLEYAPQLIEQADKLRSLMRNEQAQGCLTIGAIDLGLIAFMPTLIGRFRERYRGVNMDIRCEPSERLVEQVLDGTLDIALTDGPVQSPSLESDYAFSDQLVLITEKTIPSSPMQVSYVARKSMDSDKTVHIGCGLIVGC